MKKETSIDFSGLGWWLICIGIMRKSFSLDRPYPLPARHSVNETDLHEGEAGSRLLVLQHRSDEALRMLLALTISLIGQTQGEAGLLIIGYSGWRVTSSAR